MNIYVVESDEQEFSHNGARSQGVPSDGYPRQNPLYLHLIALPAFD